MGSMWLWWVCSDVGVVCSDWCIMGQVVDQHGGPWVMGFGFGLIWAFFWVDHVALTFSGYFLSWSVYYGSSFDRCGFYVFLGWSSTFFWVFSAAWVEMATGRVRVGFSHIRTRPAGLLSKLKPSPINKRVFYAGPRPTPSGPTGPAQPMPLQLGKKKKKPEALNLHKRT